MFHILFFFFLAKSEQESAANFPHRYFLGHKVHILSYYPTIPRGAMAMKDHKATKQFWQEGSSEDLQSNPLLTAAPGSSGL